MTIILHREEEGPNKTRYISVFPGHTADSYVRVLTEWRPIGVVSDGCNVAVYLNIIILSKSRSSDWSLSHRFRPANPICTSAVPQGRIKLFGAPRQWKYFRPLFQAVFLSGGGVLPPRQSNTTPPKPKTGIANILFYILNFASIIKFKM